MTTQASLGLHPALSAFPGAVLELAADGTVLASNGRLEATLERTLVGQPLAGALAPASQALLAALLAGDTAHDPAAVHLLELWGGDQAHPHRFCASRDPGHSDALWLVELPRDPRLQQAQDEAARASSGEAATRERLDRESARLVHSAEEREREASEGVALSRTVQRQHDRVEAQDQELLQMTRALHAGQERELDLSHQVEERGRELQMALSARDRFYGSMSHELRTPINAVIGYNDLLLASVYGPLNEQQELAIERSQRAAQHLRELVSDVLDLSRLEGGHIQLAPEPVELLALARAQADAMRVQALSAGCVLQVQGDQEVRLETDPRRVRQVLGNLISNACKFGAGTPVFVRVRARSEGGGEVEVTDGGPGIGAADLKRVFNEFVQLARAENGDCAGIEGTGLGLSISRKLATLLGGRLEASSTPGVGSSFRLTLPAAPPATPPTGAN